MSVLKNTIKIFCTIIVLILYQIYFTNKLLYGVSSNKSCYGISNLCIEVYILFRIIVSTHVSVKKNLAMIQSGVGLPCALKVELRWPRLAYDEATMA